MYGTRVYVPVASYCDKPNADGFLADGRLVAVDVVDAAIVATFDVVPGRNNMGGMWGYAGTSIDPATGHLFTATGNSWVFDPDCGCILEDVDYGESLVELDPDLNVIAANRPEGIPYVEDNDFGAAPLLFQPPGCPPLAAANAKNGVTYIWNRQNIAAGPIWSARVGPDELDASFVGAAELLAGAAHVLHLRRPRLRRRGDDPHVRRRRRLHDRRRLRDPGAADVDGAWSRPRAEVAAARRRRSRLRPGRLRPQRVRPRRAHREDALVEPAPRRRRSRRSPGRGTRCSSATRRECSTRSACRPRRSSARRSSASTSRSAR